MALKQDNHPDDDGNIYDDNAPGWRTSSELNDLENSFAGDAASDEDLPEGHPDRKRAHTQKLAGDMLKTLEGGAAAGGASDLIGGGFSPETGRLAKLQTLVRNPVARRRALVGGGIAGGITSAFIAVFLALLPFKIVGMMDNLRSHFFATSESAVSKESDTLFSYYVKKHVLPGMKGCRTSTLINKDCIAPISGNGQVSKLYQGWKDARLENKLAENYGITFELQGDHYNMTVPGQKDPLKLGADFTDPKSTKTISDLSTPEVRARYKAALEGETFLTKSMYRFKVGRLLERKYQLKRCVVACNSKDNFADWKSKEKLAAKNFLADRVLAPTSETKALILECVFQGGCDSPGSDGPNGEKRDQAQEKMAQKLASYQEKYGSEAVADIIKNSNAILEDGFTKFMVEKVTTSLISESAGVAAGQVAEKAVPIIGWIDGGAKVIKTVADTGSGLKKWIFVANSTAMVSFYQMYRTHADEIKSGHVTEGLAGSFTSSLDSGAKKDGSGEAAENSPLYANLFGASKSSGTTAFLGGALSGQAEAATTPEPCEDGPFPAGQLICPSESLKTNNFLTSVSDLFNNQPLAGLKTVADAEQKVSGLLNQAVMLIIENTPGYSFLVGKIGEISTSLMGTITQKLFPSPLTDDMSGHRAFDMLAGGADVAANAFAETGIGGQKLTNGQVAEIRNSQIDQAQKEFNNKTFFARMFDTKSQYSLVTRLAMAMPSSTNATVKTSFASLFSNPLAKISHSFATILSPAHVFADSQPADDPFGVPQFGYALNNPVFNTDPETYTDDNCKQINDAWNAATAVDPDTGMTVHTSTNPCLLVKTSAASAGATSTDAVLDPGDVNVPTGGSATNTGGGSIVSGEAKDLAQKILDNPNVTYDPGERGEFEKIAGGQNTAVCGSNEPALLGYILGLAQSHKLQISSLAEFGGKSRDCDSPHGKGIAVDIDYFDGQVLTGNNQPSNDLIAAAQAILGNRKAGFGDCDGHKVGGTGNFYFFADNCNHVHTTVEPQN